MADWQGNAIFRSGGMNYIPEQSSVAARLLAGVYGPHPNQSAPPGFGGVIAGKNGAQTYGQGSQLAQLLAAFQQANPNGPQASPELQPKVEAKAPPPAPVQQAPKVHPFFANQWRRDLDLMNPYYMDFFPEMGK